MFFNVFNVFDVFWFCLYTNIFFFCTLLHVLFLKARVCACVCVLLNQQSQRFVQRALRAAWGCNVCDCMCMYAFDSKHLGLREGVCVCMCVYVCVWCVYDVWMMCMLAHRWKNICWEYVEFWKGSSKGLAHQKNTLSEPVSWYLGIAPRARE